MTVYCVKVDLYIDGGVPATGWSAFYMGDGTCVVRSPDPLIGIAAIGESSAAKLIENGDTGRPYGRIGGR